MFCPLHFGVVCYLLTVSCDGARVPLLFSSFYALFIMVGNLLCFIA